MPIQKRKDTKPEEVKAAPEFKILKVEEESLGYKTIWTKKYETRKPYVPYNLNNITAFIPGTAGNIFVKKGEKVKKGQILMVLEAMKMNNELLAPENGIVKNINIKKGDHVIKDQVMIELK